MVHFMGLLYRIVYQQQVFFRKKEKDAARNNPSALLSPEPSEASVSSPAPVAELEAFSPEATTASPETGSEGSETCSEGVMMTATTTSSTSLQAVMETVETGASSSLEISGNTTTTPAIENPFNTVTENTLPVEVETTSEPKVTETPVSVSIPGSCTASVGVVTPVLESTAVAPVETKVPTIAIKTTQIAVPAPIAVTPTITVTPVQTTVPGSTTTTTQTVTSAPTPVCINTSVPSITTTSATQTDTPIPTTNNSTPTATSTATPRTDRDLIFTGTRKRTHDEFAKGCEKEVAQQATSGPVPVATFVLDVPDDADLTYHVHMKNRSTNEDISPPVTYQHSLSPIVRSGFYTYIMNTIGTICGRTSVSPYIHVLSAGCPRNVRSDADWDSVVMDVYNQKLVGKEGPVLVMCYV